MKVKIRRLATVVLTTAVARQTVFGQSTGARTIGQAAQRTDGERLRDWKRSWSNSGRNLRSQLTQQPS